MNRVFRTLAIVIFGCLFLPAFASPIEADQLVVDVLITNNDSVLRSSFLYNVQGQKVLETRYLKGENDDWIRLTQTEWIYNSNKCTAQIERKRINNVWVTTHSVEYAFTNEMLANEIYSSYHNNDSTHYRRVDFLYNSAGQVVLSNDRRKTGNNWFISQSVHSCYLYDGKTDSIRVEQWKNGLLEQEFISNYKYLTNGNIDSLIVKQRVAAGQWINLALTKWYYNKSSDLVRVIWNKNWNTQNQAWQNSQRIDYEYDSNKNILNETFYKWEQMYWGNVLRYTYDYNSDNNIIQRKTQLPIFKKWRDAISVEYSGYHQNNVSLIESTYDYWGGNQGELACSVIPFYVNNELEIRKATRIEFVNLPYIETGSIDAPQKRNSLIYPNPTEGICYVNLSLSSIKEWKVCDISGKMLKSSLSNLSSRVIDISELSRGIYILKVETTDNNLIIQKIIKR